MDILNWLYLRKQQLIKPTLNNKATDLVVLGAELPYTKRGDKYETYAMTVADLATAMAPELYDANGNTFVGSLALASKTTAAANTAIGYRTLTSLTAADLNVALGDSAMELMVTGSNNTAIGARALQNSTNSTNNAAIGFNALRNATTGSYNTSLGYNSLYNLSTGSYNVSIGNQSGANTTTGTSNTMVGASTDSGGFNTSIILGRGATATANKQFVVGSVTYAVGDITAEALTLTHSWTVRLNGVNYKIPLQVA